MTDRATSHASSGGAATARWHSLDGRRALEHLESDASLGLTSADAAARLARYGSNDTAAEEQRSLLAIAAGQFADFLILVLLAAAAVAGALGEFGDTAAIVVIVVLNAIVGTIQEYRAQRTVAALRRMAAPEARVVRNGGRVTIPATELVPGDIVALGAGDVVPADLRFLETHELWADESMLTGESLPVAKHHETLHAEIALGDRRNMGFKSTSVTKGRGAGVVVATGAHSEVGRIAELLIATRISRTPLQQRLAALGRRLALAVLAICALIFLLGLLQGQPALAMFLTAVSLAVAAVPEALPAVVTVSLAIGARQLTRRRALVRRLPAVETLGSVTFICADKTGTLTENRMTVASLYAGRRSLEELAEAGTGLRDALGRALALCNDVDSTASADPTEAALVDAAAEAGFDNAALLRELPRLAELAFDSERKLMTTLHGRNGTLTALTKGAPEQVLSLCETELDANGGTMALDRDAALARADALAREGFRVLALATRELAEPPPAPSAEYVERRMTFLGLTALTDPLRREVPGAIADCLSAGITPVMITGDHPETARQIASRLGLLDGGAQLLTGPQLAGLSDEALRARVRGVRVYARVDPQQKIRIVKALQQAGEFVAMTGDGVNDAPALKQASIGVAMGRRGTDVAREAADMVLLDDNFATIVAAVREGRRVYDNIRKFIKYTMTSNTGEIAVLLVAPLIGLPIPLLPIHILWINLVTDGLPGLAFSAEPAEPHVMRRPPRPRNESVFAGGMWQQMLWVGSLICGVSLATAAWAPPGDLRHWQTMVFTTLVVAQLFNALATRFEKDSLFTNPPLTNPYLIGAVLLTFGVQLLVVYVPAFNTVFKTAPLPAVHLAVCIGLGALVLPAVEIEKWLVRRGLLYAAAAGPRP